MAPYNYKTVVGPWEGVDYRPNDLERSDNAASDMLNAHIGPDNIITQRPGTIVCGPCPTSNAVDNLGLIPIAQGGTYSSSLFQAIVGYNPQGSNTSLFNNSLSVSIAAVNQWGVPVLSIAVPAFEAPLTGMFEASQFNNWTLSLGSGSPFVPIETINCGRGTEPNYSIPNNITTQTFPIPPVYSLLSAVGSIPQVSDSAMAAAPVQSIGPFGYPGLSSDGSAFHIWNGPMLSAGVNGDSAGTSGTYGGVLNLNGVNNGTLPDLTPGPGGSRVDAVTWAGTTTYFTFNGNLFKYDGVRGYTPGPPAFGNATFSFSDSVSGNVDIGTRLYGFQLRYNDANGGFVDGPLITNLGADFNDPTQGFPVTVSGSSKQVRITYSAINVPGSPINDLQVASACPPLWVADVSSGSTISTNHISDITGVASADTTPGLQPGDQVIAAAYNGGLTSIGSVVIARVLAASFNSATIDGIIPAFNAGILSRNLTLLVWRVPVTGTEFELVGEVPFDPRGATIVDNTADADLGEAYIEPVYVPGAINLAGFSGIDPPVDSGTNFLGSPVPFFKQLTIHQGVLVSTDGQQVFYSTVNSLSEFTADQNSFTIPLKAGDSIVAIYSFSGALYVWSTSALYQITGTLPQPGSTDTSFLLTQMSNSIGCVNASSIAQVEGLLVWLAGTGLYSLQAGAYPQPIDTPMRPFFQGKTGLFLSGAPLSRIIDSVDTGRACYDPDSGLYICSLSTIDPNGVPTPYKLVWNIRNGGLWELWSNIDTTTGITYIPGYGIYFIDSAGFLWRFADSNPHVDPLYQCGDNNAPIPFSYSASWEAMGAPSIAKNYTRFRVMAGDSDSQQAFVLSANLQKDYSGGSAGSKMFDFNSTNGFGLNPYGMAPYGNTSYGGLNMKPRNSKARSMRPVFTHNKLYEKVKIMGWEYELSPDFKQNKGAK